MRPRRVRFALLAALAALVVLPTMTLAASSIGDAPCQMPPEAARTNATRPFEPPNPTQPTALHTLIEIVEITDIDVRNSRYRFRAWVDFTWCDWRAAFDAKEAGREVKHFVGGGAQEKLQAMWNPNLTITNEVEEVKIRKQELTIRSDGRLRLYGIITTTLAANFDLRRFPFDAQELPVLVQSVSWPNDVLIFEGDEGYGRFVQDFDLAEWEVGEQRQIVDEVPGRVDGQVLSRLGIFTTIERRAGYYLWKAVLPLVLIVALSWTVFWISEGAAGRIRIAATVMLTIVAYQFAIASDLPRVPYVTLFTAFTTTSFITVALSAVINVVCFRRREAGDESAVERSDRLSRWLIPLLYTVAMGATVVIYLS